MYDDILSYDERDQMVEAVAPDRHRDMHSENGARAGEHPGRSADPVIKVQRLAGLEFAKPDLDEAERFAHAFGFQTAWRTPDGLYLRGSDAGTPCLVIRPGRRARFLGPTFQADVEDVRRLAARHGRPTAALREPFDGVGVDLVDPAGTIVRVVGGVDGLPGETPAAARLFNFGHDRSRANQTQPPVHRPATVQRIGHVVMMSNRYREVLDWYLENLGMIVSDFLYYEGQRARGPVMSFIRCDLGREPADHHTLALTLGPSNRYVHSAYEVADFDAVASGGEYLLAQGYRRSWGVGRHIQGSQIFDYWRDPDGFLVEHYADGDVFDSTVEPGWAPMTASGLAQWGPPASADFLGTAPGREALATVRDTFRTLRAPDNEFDLRRLGGLLKVARP